MGIWDIHGLNGWGICDLNAYGWGIYDIEWVQHDWDWQNTSWPLHCASMKFTCQSPHWHTRRNPHATVARNTFLRLTVCRIKGFHPPYLSQLHLEVYILGTGGNYGITTMAEVRKEPYIYGITTTVAEVRREPYIWDYNHGRSHAEVMQKSCRREPYTTMAETHLQPGWSRTSLVKQWQITVV